jgi:hypothetical protein
VRDSLDDFPYSDFLIFPDDESGDDDHGNVSLFSDVSNNDEFLNTDSYGFLNGGPSTINGQASTAMVSTSTSYSLPYPNISP